MLEVKDISYSYSDVMTIQNISFTVASGINLAIIGESGCGKSTLLKTIFGLYDLKSGQIFWNQTEIKGPKFHLIPGMPFMKYLAQDFDLMPFITVGENVGKYLSNFFPEEKQQRIDELLELVDMVDYKNVKANFLSGGQMQRVALARVLAQEPEVLLLDEPFSHIDNFLKNALRRKVVTYLKAKNITTLLATHDSNDVLSFSDQVLVLKEGKIIEKATPKKLFNRPKNKYVASLFGDVNEIMLDGKMQLVYPHQLQVDANAALRVIVQKSYYKGSHYLHECHNKKGILYFEDQNEYEHGMELGLEVKK
ncbi:ABC transporter ATP-binding protein [Flavobacterium sp.]|jgi:ABC-type Fe3+/spermidine/putrescine transport system ATPase subunit|uniref:ABC transporter ATP-binding protein n=1 Tax=Flavobacterium sp. TaxID=239 RepID=UPI0037C05892